VDLFSGIGGFALAARWAGIKTIQFVELDPFCQKVLNKNFSGVPIHGDIKTYSYANWNGLQKQGAEQQADRDRQFYEAATYTPPIQDDQRKRGSVEEKTGTGEGCDTAVISGNQYATERNTIPSPFLLTAGAPCQPASCAGKRRGTEDDRWLWGETFRVIAEVKPKWCILENVRGLLSLEGGLVFDNLLSELETIGYETRTFCLPACAKNAPHRRDRVWIVAHSKLRGPQERRTENDGEMESCTGEGKTSRYISATTPEPGSHVADTFGLNGAKLRGYTGDNTEHAINANNNQWNEPWLEAATRLCRMDARVSNRVDRLKSLGNAIVPQVVYPIMKAIVEIERLPEVCRIGEAYNPGQGHEGD